MMKKPIFNFGELTLRRTFRFDELIFEPVGTEKQKRWDRKFAKFYRRIYFEPTDFMVNFENKIRRIYKHQETSFILYNKSKLRIVVNGWERTIKPNEGNNESLGH